MSSPLSYLARLSSSPRTCREQHRFQTEKKHQTLSFIKLEDFGPFGNKKLSRKFLMFLVVASIIETDKMQHKRLKPTEENHGSH